MAYEFLAAKTRQGSEPPARSKKISKIGGEIAFRKMCIIKQKCPKNGTVFLLRKRIASYTAQKAARLDPNDYAKNTPAPNEWLDLEKISIEQPQGHQNVRGPSEQDCPCSGITLERKALRVICLDCPWVGRRPVRVLSPRQSRKKQQD